MPTLYDMPLEGPGAPVTGTPLIAQRAEIRARRHEGEWILDTARGLPWAAIDGDPSYPVDLLASRLVRELQGIPGVARVQVTARGATPGAGFDVLVVTEDEALQDAVLTFDPGAQEPGRPAVVRFLGGPVR